MIDIMKLLALMENEHTNECSCTMYRSFNGNLVLCWRWSTKTDMNANLIVNTYSEMVNAAHINDKHIERIIDHANVIVNRKICNGGV